MMFFQASRAILEYKKITRRVIYKKATTRFELVIRVLQTHALPLGYVAVPVTF